MKKLLYVLVAVMSIGLLATSCKKDKEATPVTPKTEKDTLTVTIKNTGNYALDLGGLGTEDGATISKATTNAASSTIERSPAGHAIYQYAPKTDFVGTDEVELKITRSAGGATPYLTTFTTIKFTITN